MRFEVIAAALLVSSTIVTVRLIDRGAAPSSEGPDLAVAQGASTPTPVVHSYASRPNEVRISAGHDNQYYVNVDINRRTASFLIDTGASYVALRESDARKAGIYTSWNDFTYPVRTANGETKAAYVTLDQMEIDDIRVEGVKAFILPDDQLSTNLLGMSFLSRIDSVEARSGEMILRG